MVQILGLALLILCCQTVLCADAATAGQMAPDISAKDDTGKEIKLASFKDKSAVVIFFFPKAGTPG